MDFRLVPKATALEAGVTSPRCLECSANIQRGSPQWGLPAPPTGSGKCLQTLLLVTAGGATASQE